MPTALQYAVVFPVVETFWATHQAEVLPALRTDASLALAKAGTVVLEEDEYQVSAPHKFVDGEFVPEWDPTAASAVTYRLIRFTGYVVPKEES